MRKATLYGKRGFFQYKVKSVWSLVPGLYLMRALLPACLLLAVLLLELNGHPALLLQERKDESAVERIWHI